MKGKTKILCSFWIFLLIVTTSTFAQEYPLKKQPPNKDEIKKAVQIWEQIIQAKGGREKLHSITNMVFARGNKPNNIGIDFYVYPNKTWRWSNAPPTPETTWVHMVNLDYGVYLVASNVGLLSNDKVSKERRRLILVETLQESCVYLLETKWLQPKPKRIKRIKIQKETLDVVETQLYNSSINLDTQMDFYVEPETLMVRWVVSYYKGKALSYYYFDGYETVQGIKMPIRYKQPQNFKKKIKKKYLMPTKFELNVEYDKSIFEKPPTVEAGSDAWKAKSNLKSVK